MRSCPSKVCPKKPSMRNVFPGQQMRYNNRPRRRAEGANDSRFPGSWQPLRVRNDDRSFTRAGRAAGRVAARRPPARAVGREGCDGYRTPAPP